MSEPERRRQTDKWHIRKTLDLGHLTTTVAAVIAAFMFFSDMNARLSVVEARSADRDRDFAEMRVDIKDIKRLLWDIHEPDK